MKEQVRLFGKWYTLVDTGRYSVVISIGEKRYGVYRVSKRDVVGYRLA